MGIRDYRLVVIYATPYIFEYCHCCKYYFYISRLTVNGRLVDQTLVSNFAGVVIF